MSDSLENRTVIICIELKILPNYIICTIRMSACTKSSIKFVILVILKYIEI